MMDSRLIEYIKTQIAYGYSEQQIRDILLAQGWYQEEIDEAFSAARSQAQPPAGAVSRPATEVSKAKEGPAPFNIMSFLSGYLLLSIAGGVLIIINSALVFFNLGDIIELFVSNLELSLLGMFDVTLKAFDAFLINLIIGIFLIIASYILYTMPEKKKLTGMFMVALSLITVFIGNGFLIGGLLGMGGGLLAILEK